MRLLTTVDCVDPTSSWEWFYRSYCLFVIAPLQDYIEVKKLEKEARGADFSKVSSFRVYPPLPTPLSSLLTLSPSFLLLSHPLPPFLSLPFPHVSLDEVYTYTNHTYSHHVLQNQNPLYQSPEMKYENVLYGRPV